MTSGTTARSILLALVLAVFGCGGGQPAPVASPPTEPSVPPAPASSGPRASPRWEPVTTFTGDGRTSSSPFTIAPDAIQWRLRWTCMSASLRITTTPEPRRPAPVVESGCPGEGEGFAIHTGAIHLNVEADGPWEAVVEQQLDGPLDEPPPPGAEAASVLAQGEFYEVENPGTGRAIVLELAEGRRVLRLEDFETLATPELFVWLTTAPNPRTSIEATEAERVELGPLRSTLGNQNYVLPADVTVDQMRSVVIWCEPVGIAYTAAALAAPGE